MTKINHTALCRHYRAEAVVIQLDTILKRWDADNVNTDASKEIKDLLKSVYLEGNHEK